MLLALLLGLSSAFRSSLRRAVARSLVLGDMRIQLYGTKNAFTTVRPHDVLLYELEQPMSEGQTQGIGIYRADNSIEPLCTYVICLYTRMRRLCLYWTALFECI